MIGVYDRDRQGGRRLTTGPAQPVAAQRSQQLPPERQR